MLRLLVNYLSSSSKSTNPPEFNPLLRRTSSNVRVLFLLFSLCPLFILLFGSALLLSSFSSDCVLASPRLASRVGALSLTTQPECREKGKRSTGTRSSYVGIFQEISPIRASGELEKWRRAPPYPNKTREIFRQSRNNFLRFFPVVSFTFLFSFLLPFASIDPLLRFSSFDERTRATYASGNLPPNFLFPWTRPAARVSRYEKPDWREVFLSTRTNRASPTFIVRGSFERGRWSICEISASFLPRIPPRRESYYLFGC